MGFYVSTPMQFDLIIVGGGLAGLALARALRDTRLKIALLENHAPTRPTGWDARVYAITPANAAFFDRIGVWKHLDASRITPIRAMHVFGDQGARLDFSAYETGVTELGWIVESALVSCELWESVKRQGNLTLLCPAELDAVEIREDTAELTFADKRSLSARLLVGADGRHSQVRSQCGLQAVTKDYGEKGVVANFQCERPHRNIARQWFREDGVLAWLPLPDNRISVVWSTPNAHAESLLALPPDKFGQRIAVAGEYALGDLSPITPPTAFPLALMRVPQTVAPRIALIGDAAHGIHPLSGHGINLGFQDAGALAELVTGAVEWQDIGNLHFLRRYQRLRREETLLMQTATDSLQRVFQKNLLGLKILRNAGMRLTNALPPLKVFLAKYALSAYQP